MSNLRYRFVIGSWVVMGLFLVLFLATDKLGLAVIPRRLRRAQRREPVAGAPAAGAGVCGRLVPGSGDRADT
jgi:hypothetical protein